MTERAVSAAECYMARTGANSKEVRHDCHTHHTRSELLAGVRIKHTQNTNKVAREEGGRGEGGRAKSNWKGRVPCVCLGIWLRRRVRQLLPM